MTRKNYVYDLLDECLDNEFIDWTVTEDDDFPNRVFVKLDKESSYVDLSRPMRDFEFHLLGYSDQIEVLDIDFMDYTAYLEVEHEEEDFFDE